MSDNFDRLANQFIDAKNSGMLEQKKNELEQLAGTADGKKVMEMLSSSGSISAAMERGDVSALRNAVSEILKTDAGANLAKKLSDIIK